MFTVGDNYTKKQIYIILNVPDGKKGGIWDTGYVQYESDFYLFVNIGIPGRTGHDYSNHWDGDKLNWVAKSGTNINQPSIKRMLDHSSKRNVFVFTRIHDKDPFTYEGLAHVFRVHETTPVKIEWTFEIPANSSSHIPVDPGQIILGTFWEGTAKKILVNKYERNPWARRECIKHYGTRCQVCNFDYQKVYGKIGDNFIHVHHLVSISSINEKYQVDPINDLIPVCANCHCMLHKKDPAYTIEELKKLIRINFEGSLALNLPTC